MKSAIIMRLTERLGLLSIGFMLLCGIVSAEAAGPERLQGAWGTTGIPCDRIFVRRGGRINFVRHTGGVFAGFIVEGNKIRGAFANCTLLNQKPDGDTVRAALTCRQQIIFDKVVVHLRFKDDNTIVRYEPEFPELESSFRRCTL